MSALKTIQLHHSITNSELLILFNLDIQCNEAFRIRHLKVNNIPKAVVYTVLYQNDVIRK
jgi:hypothetical protein